jgi:hypothetical protein
VIRALAWLLFGATVGLALCYGLGLWLLGRQGVRLCDLYRAGYGPPVYDGKVPYAVWAEQMERARRVQERD